MPSSASTPRLSLALFALSSILVLAAAFNLSKISFLAESSAAPMSVALSILASWFAKASSISVLGETIPKVVSPFSV